MTQPTPTRHDSQWHQSTPWRRYPGQSGLGHRPDEWVERTPALYVFDAVGSAVIFAGTRTTLALTDDQVREEFERLAAEWSGFAAISPDPVQMFMHVHYQRIIGMGPQVLPHILESLERELDHWFWALTAIVGEDIASGAKNLPEAAARWLAWGRRVGLIS